MKKLKLDHVERLSHGQRSGLNIGSRSVGHYLKSHERSAYERALKKGYLDIHQKDRANLWHIWEKACLAMQWQFLVLVKHTESAIGTIYLNDQMLSQHKLSDAKLQIQGLASSNSK